MEQKQQRDDFDTFLMSVQKMSKPQKSETTTSRIMATLSRLGKTDVIKLMIERGFDYLYIGQQQGKVNFGGEFLDIELLASDPHFQQVFHQDRVWIFKIIAQPGKTP